MLFNSTLFLFVFLPVSVAVFFVLSRVESARGGANAAITWLILVSIFFYAWWNPAQLWVPVASAIFNLGMAGTLYRTPAGRARLRQMLLAAGIAGNVALLFYFKTRISPWFSDLAPGGFSVAQEILIPLGISFLTFRQIAFLVDGQRDNFSGFSIRDYLLYLFFFPQQVMGPIVRYQDIAAQTARMPSRQVALDDIASGLAIFAAGLAKKVLLADSLAIFPDRIFAAAATGTPIGFIDAWVAALMFLFQIYFDFSGYADMAIGAARLFGINLPLNFDAPFRAADRFDFWRRWHITFAVFMRQYVFTPLVRRARLPVLPALLLTALLSGLWHGLSPTFLAWSAGQVSLLLAAHYFRMHTRNRPAWQTPGIIRVQVLITLALSAGLAIVFRASDLASAWTIYRGMLGFNGAGIPAALAGIGGLAMTDVHARTSFGTLALLAGATFIIWCLPTTQRLFAAVWTATDARGERDRSPPADGWSVFNVRFRFSLRWAIFIAGLMVSSWLLLDRTSRFVYSQF